MLRASSALLALLASLSACSSGDTPLTGALTAFVASGVHYETPTFTGETNASGEFQYRAGEVIRFSIGDVVLAEVPAAPELTLFDLAETTRASNLSELEAAGTNYARMLNMAVLLESLDTNGDATDGVIIEAEVADLLVGAEIDLEVARVSDHRGGERIGDLNRAVLLAQEFFDVAHPISPTPRAAAALYAVAGANMAAFARTRADLEVAFEGLEGTHSAWNYDAEGKMRTAESDIRRDRVLLSSSFDYDAWGYRTRRNETTFTRDAAGNLIEEAYRENRTTIVRDERGAPLRTEVFIDGRFQSATTYSYTDGLLVSEVSLSNAGNVESSIIYTYDAAGRELTNLREGAIPTLNSRTYDTEGNVLSQEVDDFADGTVDKRTRYEYDTAGERRLMIEERFSDGALSSRAETIFSADGGSVQTRDTNSDGVIDEISMKTISDDGRSRTSSTDRDADGTIDSQSTVYLDENMNIILEDYDRENDGTVDQRVRFTFEPTGWFALPI